MPFCAQAQQDEVKMGPGRIEIRPQHTFIRLCCFIGFGEAGEHGMDIPEGNRNLAEKVFLYHAIVAARVMGRHVALVPPKEMDLLPGNPVAIFSAQKVV